MAKFKPPTFKTITTTIKGAIDRIPVFWPDTRNAAGSVLNGSAAEKAEKEERRKKVEAVLRRGRRKLRNPEVKKRVDEMLGRAKDEDDESASDADESNDTAGEYGNLKDIQLFRHLLEKSSAKESELYENAGLLSLVIKLLHNYHFYKKDSEENTIVEKINIDPENLLSILRAVFESLYGTGINRSDVIKIISQNEVNPTQILFTKGFQLDENADSQVLKEKIEKLNSAMQGLKELRNFGNIYQKDLGKKQAARGLGEAYRNIENGMSVSEAMAASAEDIPAKFDTTKRFDVKEIDKLLSPRVKPNIRDIVESGEIDTELETLTHLANILSASDDVYTTRYQSLFEGKQRLEVIRELNGRTSEYAIGTVLFTIKKDVIEKADVLNRIFDTCYLVSNKDELVAKVREIYAALADFDEI